MSRARPKSWRITKGNNKEATLSLELVPGRGLSFITIVRSGEAQLSRSRVPFPNPDCTGLAALISMTAVSRDFQFPPMDETAIPENSLWIGMKSRVSDCGLRQCLVARCD